RRHRTSANGDEFYPGLLTRVATRSMCRGVVNRSCCSSRHGRERATAAAARHGPLTRIETHPRHGHFLPIAMFTLSGFPDSSCQGFETVLIRQQAAVIEPPAASMGLDASRAM